MPSTPRSYLAAIPVAALVALAGALLPATPAFAQASPEINETELYEFLLGEIALQRGERELAARTYLQLARETRDPRVARRAIEVANFARLPDLSLEAAKLWYELEPGSEMERSISGGWPIVLSNLKTLLETGATLPDIWTRQEGRWRQVRFAAAAS